MRIGILTQNYPPEPDTIIHNLAKALVAKGSEVQVITGFPNYPEGKIYPGYKQRLLSREVMDGVEVLRLPLYPDRSRSALKRSLNYLSFPLVASFLAPFITGKIDVLIVRHPPVTIGVPGLLVSLLRRVPFVFEIQDMWPETLTATGMMNNRGIIKALDWLGNLIYAQADAIVVISPGFKRNLVHKGVRAGKIHVVYNSAYEGYYGLPPREERLAEELGLAGKFNVLYAGNMGPAQGLDNVIEAASRLQDLPEVQFVLVGSGIDTEKLQEKARGLGLGNVRFLGRRPMDQMPSLYCLVDAVLVHLDDDPLWEMTVPGKTQSCLLTGKPVIASVNGDVSRIIDGAGCGLSAAAMNPDELAAAVRRLYAMTPAQREGMGHTGRCFYLETMAPDKQAENYLEVFRKMGVRAAG